MSEISTSHDSVCAIVVTYYPNQISIRHLINRVIEQVDGIVIVDNTDKESSRLSINQDSIPGINVNLISIGENKGLAEAQNIAIRWANARKFTHILLLDQDSKPDRKMVSNLLRVEKSLSDSGNKLAAVGPSFIDKRQKNSAAFSKLSGLYLKRIYCKTNSENEYYLVDYLIASGMLIRMRILDEIGYMDDKLFIDYVDIEWGLRASTKGYCCYGVCSAMMEHSIGDNALILPFFKKKRIPLHGYVRRYYIFRNAISLYKRPYINWKWKVNDAYRLILKYFVFSFIAAPRLRNVVMMSKGIVHGIAGKMGRFT